MYLAGTSAKGQCPQCGAAWERVTEHIKGDTEAHDRPKQTAGMSSKTSTLSLSGNGSKEWAERGAKTITLNWQPSCACGVDPVPDLVLDPFGGSGTTAEVALKHGRRAILIELNPNYVELQKQRLAKYETAHTAPLFEV